MAQPVVYTEINATDDTVTKIESLCMNCEKNGETKILLRKIPFFREIILMSFECGFCGFKNCEIQSGAQLNEKGGQKITLTATKFEDLSREIVRSEHASIRIPELEFEIPACKKAFLSTVEGVISNSIEELSHFTVNNKENDPENCVKVELFIQRLRYISEGKEFPFHFIIDDPSGNSYIKNPLAPSDDPNLKSIYYPRTKKMLESMGFGLEAENQVITELQEEEKEEQPQSESKKGPIIIDYNKPLTDDVKGESYEFSVPCHSCGRMASTKMCTTSVPFFKEIIIMSFNCDKCGYKNTEVKCGGEIPPLGRKLTLKCFTEKDLKRDCFKSETCHLIIPEVDFEMRGGSRGGAYTTIEGLIDGIITTFVEQNPFIGDSEDTGFKSQMNKFVEKLTSFKDGGAPFTVILDDPLANSFIQNPDHPAPDPQMTIVDYERSYHQNEELGLIDMKVENYGEK